VVELSNKEKLNALTHLGGLAGALAFSLWILPRLFAGNDLILAVSTSLFCASMIALYSSSSLYHLARDEEKKRRLKVLDHSAIFVLIAGSYTPFALAGLKGAWGWSLFGVIWGLALLGIVFKLFFTGRFKLASTLLYIAMGWLVVIAGKPLIERLSSQTLLWLVLGGIFYTLGTVFYLNKMLRYGHALWHIFVILGTAGHAVSLYHLAYPAG